MERRTLSKRYSQLVRELQSLAEPMNWGLFSLVREELGKDAALLIYLAKTEDTCPFNEAVAGIVKLRQLRMEMDHAVLEAYGWTDVYRHDFYEVYLPENNRIRYTIHPAARKEILKQLLELNHKIHEEEGGRSQAICCARWAIARRTDELMMMSPASRSMQKQFCP